MLAIKFGVQHVTEAAILHAIYYMSKQEIEFDNNTGSLKSLVKAKSLSVYKGGRNFSFENLLHIKAGKNWNLLELKDWRWVPAEWGCADRTAQRRPLGAVLSTYPPLLTCKVDVKWVFGFIPLRWRSCMCDYLAPLVQNLGEGLHVPVGQWWAPLLQGQRETGYQLGLEGINVRVPSIFLSYMCNQDMTCCWVFLQKMS